MLYRLVSAELVDAGNSQAGLNEYHRGTGLIIQDPRDSRFVVSLLYLFYPTSQTCCDTQQAGRKYV